MVYAFVVHTLNPGPCRVLYSSVFIHEQVASIVSPLYCGTTVSTPLRSTFSFGPFISHGQTIQFGPTADLIFSSIHSGLFHSFNDTFNPSESLMRVQLSTPRFIRSNSVWSLKTHRVLVWMMRGPAVRNRFCKWLSVSSRSIHSDMLPRELQALTTSRDSQQMS